MPIFQADLEHCPVLEPEPVVAEPPTASRRASEESLRTELCEGPIPDSPPSSVCVPSHDAASNTNAPTSDRAELIERLKRGQSPTWIPSAHMRNRSPQIDYAFAQDHQPRNRPVSPRSPSRSSMLLPPAQITPEKPDPLSIVDERLRQGLNIERPRSALHSGDFTNDQQAEHGQGHDPENPGAAGRLTEAPWAATSPPRHFTPFSFGRATARDHCNGSFVGGASSLSSSLSSSFIYQAPTSPLVQSESNEELDLSMPLDHVDFPRASFGSRRPTLNSAASSPFASPSPRFPLSGRPSMHRREGSLPYQAHQPRRSLTSTPHFSPHGTPPPPSPTFARSRRQSVSSDSSPLHHASMVGSYEESILRGRMSTTPSKPLDFVAQIGVLGKGNCKASLRCPSHVTLPFPAVYYSYSNNGLGRAQLDDGPSPYVGQIDLENGLPNTDEESRIKRKAHSRYADRHPFENDFKNFARSLNQDTDTRQAQRSKRGSSSLRAPPGGSYRIPEKGQVQIVIKNPNKTAVKLFLVPYDLAGMEPGTKTFIRQRSYSTGPIIDNIPSITEMSPSDRPILRYLVHLHICCPSKGRYYLYKSIRIVFANRVPDGKEKLRNETTWPEPRFSPYRPIRVMHPPLSTSNGPGAMLAAEKALRRRSLGISLGSSSQALDFADGFFPTGREDTGRGSSDMVGGNTLPIEPVPFRLPRQRHDSVASDTAGFTGANPLSPTSSQASRPSTTDSSVAGWNPNWYEKLNKGELGYGGNAFNLPGGRGPGNATEGLLSQRLRSLGVNKGMEQDVQDAQE